MEFKVGDKVRCIDNEDGYYDENLTVNKVYDVVGIDYKTNVINIKGNSDTIRGFYSWRFVLANTLSKSSKIDEKIAELEKQIEVLRQAKLILG